ncbi:MAG: hypothetical protein LC130_33440 [Bryobacterales bacterium]|nr:hypothetical protein [Bryobacterales bacterium]
MSKQTQDSDSGTPAVKPTASELVMSEAARQWALTVALQKTEWHDLIGIATRLLSFRDKRTGRLFVGVVFFSPSDDLTADNDAFTFLVNGVDVDEVVANLKCATPDSGTPKKEIVKP